MQELVLPVIPPADARSAWQVSRLLTGLVVAATVSSPGIAWVGRPGFTLTDAANVRLDAISFFGMVFLVCSAIVRLQ